MRVAGGTARNYVEGATTGCSASGNAAKHIPALYYFGTYTDGTGSHNDHDFCNTEVRPYSEFDPNNLPTYAFITPTLCNDGHDCNDATVDAWASTNIQRVLDSAAYKAGTVAVFISVRRGSSGAERRGSRRRRIGARSPRSASGRTPRCSRRSRTCSACRS